MEPKKNTQVIAVGNQKGGVGKTSNTVNLAAGLGELGYKSLIIDLDGNCGATKALGVGTDWLGTLEVLLGDHEAEDVIVSTDPTEGTELPKNVELLPARRNLESYTIELQHRNKFADPTSTLGPVLEKLKGKYDFIFLDTAPNAEPPTVSSYRCADWFILSTEASTLSVSGLQDALTDIIAVREAGNAKLRLLGVIMCKVDRRTRIATSYVEQIRKDFESAGEMGAFETLITRATALEQAQREGKSLFDFAPGHKITDQFRALTREVLERIENASAAESAEVEPEAEGVVANA